MKLGISSWTVPWSIGVPGYPQPRRPLDSFDLLDKAVAVQVQRVQIADNLPLERLDDQQLDQLGKAATERGLTLEGGTRGVDPEHLGRYIGIAHRIGAPFLRTVLSGSHLGREQLAKTEASIRSVVPLLEANRVTLALENNEAFSAREYAELFEAIGHPLVRSCLDTANSLGRPETLETVVEHLASYVVMLHAKDYDIRRVDTRMGFSVIGRRAGEGRVDFSWLIGELRRRAGNEISVILEHWPPFERTIDDTLKLEEEWLAGSISYLQRVLSSRAGTVN